MISLLIEWQEEYHARKCIIDSSDRNIDMKIDTCYQSLHHSQSAGRPAHPARKKPMP